MRIDQKKLVDSCVFYKIFQINKEADLSLFMKIYSKINFLFSNSYKFLNSAKYLRVDLIFLPSLRSIQLKDQPFDRSFLLGRGDPRFWVDPGSSSNPKNSKCHNFEDLSVIPIADQLFLSLLNIFLEVNDLTRWFLLDAI